MDISKKRILFCDLDGTLIKTISGKPFAEDVTDFRLRKDVLDKIRSVASIAHIAIVTNQGGIPKFVSKRDFEAKLKAVGMFLTMYTGCPVRAAYCDSLDKDNPSRKPNPGMLESLYAGDYPSYDKSQMLMIGDASGKPGQFSDSDKKCAENFGIDYLDVEDFVNIV